MELKHITLENLTPARANVRKTGARDVTDLTASIAALGLLQPLLVRPAEDGFEIVAGQRRYHALCALAEDGKADLVPCIVMGAHEEATAVEASLAENLIRLPMDEIDQYKAFAALVRKGMGSADIAAHFAVSEQLVTRRLAIANLLPPILTLYRKEAIGPDTLRILTMATKAQQKDWLALHKDDPRTAPEGWRLRNWLFGGAQIATEAALFDLAAYDGHIVADLFGEASYFDDPDRFWAHQNAAIAALKAALEAEGWPVDLLETGARFETWNHVDAGKEEGGKAVIQVDHDGAVTVFKGQLSRQALKQREAGDMPPAPKPECTKPMENYLDLHRHAAVRHELAGDPGLALRVTVAQILTGSALWSVEADPQKARSGAIADSLATSKAEPAFAETRQAVAALLNLSGDGDTLVPRKADWHVRHDFTALLSALCALDDAAVLRVLAYLTAETLAVGSEAVDLLGAKLGTDMRDYWAPDATFFDLIRSKPALNAMVAELAGESAAAEHITATAKTQKAILQACLDGTRTAQIGNWQPRYMDFPMGFYLDAAPSENAQDKAA